MGDGAARPLSKQQIRERVWRALEVHGAARFPGARGRIPDFAGAERAALSLQALPEWKRGRVVRINADAAQLPVRRLALREGKVVYVPVPRLSMPACFIELDPGRLGARCRRAATLAGAVALGRTLTPAELRPVDLIVCGAVAVNGRGARVGEGGGFSDLEYGMLRERGQVSERTVVLTSVHPLQLVPHEIEMGPHDIVLDWIATPDGLLRCGAGLPRPRGIYWEELDEARTAAVPALAALRPAAARS